MRDNKRSEKLSSYFLRNKMLPYGIKTQIFLYSFILILYNCMIAYQKESHYILFALLGVLPSFIELKTKVKAYLCASLSLIIVMHGDIIFFYVLYGYVLSVTYQISSTICLCLRKESFEYIQKLEVFCLILSNLVLLRKSHIIFLLIINLLLVYKAKKPPHEVKDKQSFAKIHKYIKELIVEEDYCLIAEEYRMIIKNELCTTDTIYDKSIWFNLVYPLYVMKIDTLCKVTVFSFSLFTYTKYTALFIFFTFF